MLCHQKGKVGILCTFCRILKAVSVYRYDTVGIFIYYASVRVHTEGTYIILELLCTVYNLAFVKFICQI